MVTIKMTSGEHSYIVFPHHYIASIAVSIDSNTSVSSSLAQLYLLIVTLVFPSHYVASTAVSIYSNTSASSSLYC